MEEAVAEEEPPEPSWITRRWAIRPIESTLSATAQASQPYYHHELQGCTAALCLALRENVGFLPSVSFVRTCL